MNHDTAHPLGQARNARRSADFGRTRRAASAQRPRASRSPSSWAVRLPRWALVRHRMDVDEVADVAAAVGAALEPRSSAIRPGSRVCLAVGSRGIDRIDEVVRAAVAWVRSAGAEVFVVPAMGSHGGATAEGQLEVLASYGMTPESIGCEIRSSMETVELGEVRPGVPGLRGSQRLRRRRHHRSDQPRQAAHGLQRRDRERSHEDDRHRAGQAEGRRHIPSPGFRDLPRADSAGGRVHAFEGQHPVRPGPRRERLRQVVADRGGAARPDLGTRAGAAGRGPRADGPAAAATASTCWCSTTSARTSAAWAWIPTSWAATTPGRPATAPASSGSWSEI